MICDAIPALVAEQPAMVCDLLNFLTTWEPPESFRGFKILRDQLFTYIRSMSHKILPEASPFRRFTFQLHDREAFTRLGATIAKAKVDTMWNTTVGPAGQTQHDRPFFRQVLINAILVVMDYGELEFASMLMKKLADYDPEDPYYLAACARLCELQGKYEEVKANSHEALALNNTLNASKPVQTKMTFKEVAQGQKGPALERPESPKLHPAIPTPTPEQQSDQSFYQPLQPLPLQEPPVRPNEGSRPSLVTRSSRTRKTSTRKKTYDHEYNKAGVIVV